MNQDETPPKPIYVYVLTDPRYPDDVRYVGITNNPKGRLRLHIAKSKEEKNHRANWINSLVRNGFSPIMTIIDETDDENWVQCEMGWIAHYRGLGCDLVNSTDGGEGTRGIIRTEEQRRNQAERMRGRKASDKTRRKHSEYWLGEKNPNYGKPLSAEHRCKLSESKKGKKCSEEHRKKISDSQRNKNPIIQYTKGGVFICKWDSIKKAGRMLGISPSHIGGCCKRKPTHKTAGGYIWRYADDPLPTGEVTQLSFNFDE